MVTVILFSIVKNHMVKAMDKVKYRKRDNLKSDLKKVQISNVSGFQIPTVVLIGNQNA